MNILNPVRAVWGAITGTLSQQTDLQDALDAKADSANPVFTGTLTAPLVSIDNPGGNADFYMAPSIGRVIHVGATTNDSFGVYDETNAKWLFQVSSTDAVSFTGPVSASNFSGSSSGDNTGDQDLAPYALLSGAAFAGNISAKNLSGSNTGDQNLAPYAELAGATFTGAVVVNFAATNQVVITAGGGVNGANLVLEGNGAVAPNKYLRAINGMFQVVNSGYTATLLSVNDSGDGTFAGTVAATNFSGSSSGNNTGDQSLEPYALLSGANFTGAIRATNFSGSSSGTNTGDQDIPTNNDQLANGAGYVARTSGWSEVVTGGTLAPGATLNVEATYGQGQYIYQGTSQAGGYFAFACIEFGSTLSINSTSNSLEGNAGGGLVCINANTVTFNLWRWGA